MSRKATVGSASLAELNALLRMAPATDREAQILAMLNKYGSGMRLDFNSNTVRYTSLMLAIESGFSTKVLKSIIDHASEMSTYDVQNAKGQTAWQMLLQKQKTEAFMCLFAHPKCRCDKKRLLLATEFYKHGKKVLNRESALSETIALLRFGRLSACPVTSFDLFVKSSLISQAFGTDTPLSDLADDGVPTLLKAYLSDRSLRDVNYVDSETGMNALHFAVLSGRPAVVKAVLAAGYTIQADKRTALTPLHYVCGAVAVSGTVASLLFVKNRETILSLLLRKLRSMDKKEALKVLNQKSAIASSSSFPPPPPCPCYSCMKNAGRGGTLNALSRNNIYDPYGPYYKARDPTLERSALHMAASSGLLCCVKMLLRGDTATDETDNIESNACFPLCEGKDAIGTVCVDVDADTEELLPLVTVQADKAAEAADSSDAALTANVFETDTEGQTALHICANNATSATSKVFVAIATSLLEAAKKMREKSAKSSTSAGTSVGGSSLPSLISIRDSQGRLPMHYASSKEMVDFFTSVVSVDRKKGEGAPDEHSKDYSPFGSKLDVTHALFQTIEAGKTQLVPFYLRFGCYHDVPMHYKHSLVTGNSERSKPICVVPSRMEIPFYSSSSSSSSSAAAAAQEQHKSETVSAIVVTPLELAILRNDVKTVTLLLGDGAHANRLDILPRLCFVHNPALASPSVKVLQTSPLFAAICVSSPEIVAVLLRTGAYADDPIRSPSDRYTVLTSAIAKGNRSIVHLLLGEGKADPNQQANSEQSFMTPLFTAIRGGKIEIVELLMNHGANPAAISTWKGWNVLHFAASISAPAEIIAKIMLQVHVTEQNRNNTKGKVPATPVAELDINRVSADGFTPLSIACIRGDVSVVTVLVECGADIMQADAEDGWTPLHFAAYYNRTHVIEYLLRCGADRTARTKGYETLGEKRRAQLQTIQSKDSPLQGSVDTDGDVIFPNPNKDYPWKHVFSGAYTPIEVAAIAKSTAAIFLLVTSRVAAPSNVSGPVHGEALLDSAGNDAKQQEVLKLAHEVRSGQRVVVVKKRKTGDRRIPIEDRPDFEDYDRSGYNRYGIYVYDDDWESKVDELDLSEYDDSDAFYSTTDDEESDEGEGDDDHWAPPKKRYIPERRK